MTIGLIIPAAGSGSRFGSEIPKQYLTLRALPVLIRTISIFTQIREIGPIVVAVAQDRLTAARELIEDYHPRRVAVVEGGSERQHSIASCLDHPSLRHAEIVLVHDAVRPLCSATLVRALIAGAAEFGACVPGMPVSDTTKEIDEQGFVVRTHPRERLRSIQTPQAFRREILREAYAHCIAQQIVTTDDASVVEAYGHDVKVIDGEMQNIKITTPQDFDLAERWIDAGITEAVNLRYV